MVLEDGGGGDGVEPDMKDAYFYDGRMQVEADHMTPSDAVLIPKASQQGTQPTKCEFDGCNELTIFGMCRPHMKEMDKRLGEYLIKNGWTKVFGGADESSGDTDPTVGQSAEASERRAGRDTRFPERG